MNLPPLFMAHIKNPRVRPTPFSLYFRQTGRETSYKQNLYACTTDSSPVGRLCIMFLITINFDLVGHPAPIYVLSCVINTHRLVINGWNTLRLTYQNNRSYSVFRKICVYLTYSRITFRPLSLTNLFVDNALGHTFSHIKS